METYKDIELYKTSHFTELDRVSGKFTVEIKDGKARVKPQDLFGELAGHKSRFNTLRYVGGYSGGGGPKVTYHSLRINYEDYYFKIAKVDPKTLLEQYGFRVRVADLPNALVKHQYKAVIWGDNVTVSITYHTPNTGRFLSSTTYYNPLLLIKELEKNHK